MIESKGVIGVIAQETARYSWFAASLTEIAAPEGTKIHWAFGHDIAENANMLVRNMYEADAQWLWILGDDHTFNPQTLARLLEHDKDIVVPLCLMRNPPYRPVIFADENNRVDLNEHPDGGLIEVHAAGSGGMLIKREVFNFMVEPWFEAGVRSSVQLGEDVYFCEKAREAGFSVWADLDITFGHCTTSVVWPVREPDGWTFGFSMAGGFQITMPPGFQAYADGMAAQ